MFNFASKNAGKRKIPKISIIFLVVCFQTFKSVIKTPYTKNHTLKANLNYLLPFLGMRLLLLFDVPGQNFLMRVSLHH